MTPPTCYKNGQLLEHGISLTEASHVPTFGSRALDQIYLPRQEADHKAAPSLFAKDTTALATEHFKCNSVVKKQ